MPNEITAKSRSSYVTRVKDHLETHWFTYFEGWSIDNLENGEVLLSNRRIVKQDCMVY